MDTDSHDAVNDAAIDQTAIEELRDEGEDLLSELVEMFIGEVPGQLATLEEALAKEDAGAVRLNAHTLKGTGGNFGASRMQALAGAIEEKGRSRSLDGAAATFAQLRAECVRVREALEAVRRPEPLAPKRFSVPGNQGLRSLIRDGAPADKRRTPQ
jgi:HPt (histidine-containing phosphotransfer) domain-containing protein